jgi:hypothetical protein
MAYPLRACSSLSASPSSRRPHERRSGEGRSAPAIPTRMTGHGAPPGEGSRPAGARRGRRCRARGSARSGRPSPTRPRGRRPARSLPRQRWRRSAIPCSRGSPRWVEARGQARRRAPPGRRPYAGVVFERKTSRAVGRSRTGFCLPSGETGTRSSTKFESRCLVGRRVCRSNRAECRAFLERSGAGVEPTHRRATPAHRF